MISKRTFIITFTVLTAFFSAEAKNCLWKATSESGKLYVQGSVHVLKADDYPLPAAIEEAYAMCDAIVLEVDMKEMVTQEAQQLILSKALLQKGKTLKDSLAPNIYAQLSEKMNEANLSPIAYQSLKPWYVALTLTLTKMQSMGFESSLGLDQYFYNKAVADKKPIIGLETVAFQINLFDALAEGNQNDYIMHALKEMDLLDSQLDELMAAWKTGDMEALSRVLLHSFEDFPKLYDRFLVDRNKAWIKKIAKLTSKDKTYMILVGAAHLPGEDGLLDMLKKEGYTLEQL